MNSSVVIFEASKNPRYFRTCFMACSLGEGCGGFGSLSRVRRRSTLPLESTSKTSWHVGQIPVDCTNENDVLQSGHCRIRGSPTFRKRCLLSGITTMLTEPPTTRLPFQNGPTGASVQHIVRSIRVARYPLDCGMDRLANGEYRQHA